MNTTEARLTAHSVKQPRFYIARVTDNGTTFTRASRLTFTNATVATRTAQIMNRDRDEQDEADGAEYCAVTEMVP